MSYTIAEIFAGAAAEAGSITVKAWVRTRRDSKAGFSFLSIYDGSCFAQLQAVIPNSLKNYTDEVLHLTAGCAVVIEGKIVASQGKGQQLELQAESVEVIGWIDDPETYPISPKRHSLEYLREYPHLRQRTNIIGAVTRVRHQLAHSIHCYLHQHGFYWINTPIITANDCEGAGELFHVSALDLANIPKTADGQVDYSQDFFGRETFLTVSGQLNVESYCLALSKVYTFGPTFRAENSNTSRHLSEFWMIEPEIAFAELSDIASLSEDLLRKVCRDILTERADDMEFFNKWVDKQCIERLQHIINSDFERMEYRDAIKVLEKAKRKFEFPVQWGMDLQSEHERYLAEEYVGRPIILQNYHKDIKAFYMRVNADDQTVAAMDVLVPGIGEIIGGSQREERLEYLDKRMQEMKIDPAGLQWYRDLRRYGTVPHAGFGLGFERLISYVTGINNIREAIPFPRTPKHCMI